MSGLHSPKSLKHYFVSIFLSSHFPNIFRHAHQIDRTSIDALIIYAGRGLRDMGRGLIAVVIAIYLAAIGLSIPQIGLVLGISLLGGFALSVLVMFGANVISRRLWFVIISAITGIAVVMLIFTDNVWLICVASFFGSYAGSGAHWGPSLQLEQASLT